MARVIVFVGVAAFQWLMINHFSSMHRYAKVFLLHSIINHLKH